MKRKLVLSLAISLDGYICDSTGGYDWIKGHGDKTANTRKKFSMLNLMDKIGTILMGRKTYDEVGVKEIANYEEKEFLVATKSKEVDKDNIRFIGGDLVEILNKEKEKEGKDILIYGGADIVEQCLHGGIIDVFTLIIVPTVLGGGVSLFKDINKKVDLHLEELYSENGIIVATYTKRKEK